MFLVVLLTGCNAPRDDGELACGVTGEFVAPHPSQGDFYFRSPLEAELSDPDPTASLSLVNVAGAPVPGLSSVNEDADRVVFTPALPLEPLSAYTAVLRTCAQTRRMPFRTSALGSPMEDPGLVIGRTYLVDLGAPDVRITRPEGVGDVLKPYFDLRYLMHVDSGSDTSLRMIGAHPTGEGSGQDTCLPTGVSPVIDYDPPFFSFPPMEMGISWMGLPVEEVSDLSFHATFSPSGREFGGGLLNGFLDTRPAGPWLPGSGASRATTAICDTLAGFGVACEPCPADGEPYCLDLEVMGINGAWVEGQDLDAVALADCHPDCPSTFSTDPSTGACVPPSNPECELTCP